MSRRRLPVISLPATVVVLLLAAPAATAPPAAPPDPTCSPGPADCSAWHNTAVVATWAAPPAGVIPGKGCAPRTISADTSGTPVSCTWSNADGSRTTTAYVRKDSTPPSVKASAERPPDTSGWYNHKLGITFSGDDSLSGIAACTTASYSGPDLQHASVPGRCTDRAGNTRETAFALRYDATPPAVAAKPDRHPDANGWYNHALTIAFSGSDAIAGVYSCSAPVPYQGPDNPKAVVSGTCRDRAGNTSPPAQFALKYDTVPPKLKRVRVALTSEGVALSWSASKDARSYEIVRAPGLQAHGPSTIYSGSKRTFLDWRVGAGVRYEYTITAFDQAGNVAVKVVFAQPEQSGAEPVAPAPRKKPASKPALVGPAEGARLTVPPRLTWRRVPNATYYNVQVYRNGRKILTAWPREARFRLQRSWSYRGRRYALTPGRYRWYVWPGFGPRASHRYGRLVGARNFVVYVEAAGPSGGTS